MAAFDLQTFLTLQGQGQGVLGSIGTSFGFPSCLLNLTEELFNLLPRSVLESLNEAASEGRAQANKLTTAAFNRLSFQTGIVSFDTEQGLLTFGSNSSEVSAASNAKAEAEGLNSFVNALGFVAGAGGQLYRNYQNISSQYETIKGCIDGFLKTKQYSGGLSADQRQRLSDEQYRQRIDAEYNAFLRRIRIATAEAARITNTQEIIQRILNNRDQNPDLEPVVASEYAYLVSGTDIKVESLEDETGEELIRLVYGPPQSSKGKYLLSVDGLYYDSQTDEGLEPVLLFVNNNKDRLEAAQKWKFNFDPNIGGKGDQISSKNFNEWVNSIFDPTIIDDGETIRHYYDRDHFLKVLEGQKEKRILDINKQIERFEFSGVSQSIIDNYKQTIISEVAYHNDKINRRKKQIEIAVKAPTVFGKGTSPEPGKVPINDFSYLRDCNISLALDTQRKMILDQASVSGVVLPLRPTFVVSKSVDSVQTIEHLVVPEVGLGAIITDNRDPLESSGLELAISDVVTDDGVIAVYNFLNSITTTPSSVDFDVLNCVTSDDYNNAQLVAPNAQFVFGSSTDATFGFGYGLGAAYLEGITKNFGTNPSALGSYVKLPDTREFQDWLYNRSGATFDTWVYAPYLTFDDSWDEGLSTSSLYRLILACENTGSLPSVIRTTSNSILDVEYSDGSDFTKGLIFGFTRDIRWRGQSGPSNDGRIQKGEDGGLILAPTIAYDGSSVAFIAKAKAQGSCEDTSGWLGMYVPLTTETVSGKSLEDCSKGFCQLSVTFDYKEDAIKLYLDSELLATSSVSQVFGTPITHAIKIPTFKKANSFEYNENSVGYLAPRSLRAGPKLNSFFTPWILGGGYTDGMAASGNFMGGEYGGVRSGLRGYLGSTKFYSKPLNQKQLNFNYSIQSKLYKNLDAVNNEYNIIIALGQSNIDGVSATLADAGVPERFRRVQPRTKIWMPENWTASAGTWEYLDPVNIANQSYGGYNTTRYENPVDPQFRFNFNTHRYYDPLMQFMQRMADDLNDDVYLIKNAKGSTAMVSGLGSTNDILSWTENTSTPGFQGADLYSTLKFDLSAAISSLRGPAYTKVNVKAILMMQGEFEAGNTVIGVYANPGDMAQEWDTCFSELLYPRLQADIKASLETPNAPDIPVIFTQVHSELQSVQFPFVAEVQAQQAAAAARPEVNAYLVDVDGLSFTDGTRVHFNAESLTTIGNKLYDKYKEITE